MMVLFAAAAENLLKAVLVANGSPAVENGYLSKKIKGHDMPDFAARAGLAPTPDEAALLEQLQDLMESGKYPIGFGPGGNASAWRLEYPRDVQRTWLLLDRLQDLLARSGRPCLPRINVRTRHRPPGYAITETM
jgi:hypothetical protein